MMCTRGAQLRQFSLAPLPNFSIKFLASCFLPHWCFFLPLLLSLIRFCFSLFSFVLLPIWLWVLVEMKNKLVKVEGGYG
jgi:hypothetical protein